MMTEITCKNNLCNNEVIQLERKRGYPKKFCSAKCRNNVASRKYSKKYPDRKAKWRRNNKQKYKICIIKSMLRGLSIEERKIIFEEVKVTSK